MSARHARHGNGAIASIPTLAFALCAATVLPLVVSGCARHLAKPPLARRVELELVLPQGADRHAPAPDEVFFAPGVVAQPLPALTGAAVDGEVTVCLSLVVAIDGTVAAVEPVDLGPDCARPSPATDAHRTASIDAMRSWSFVPAATCRYRVAESECDRRDAPSVAVPVRLAYRLRFSATGVRVEAQGDRD